MNGNIDPEASGRVSIIRARSMLRRFLLLCLVGGFVAACGCARLASPHTDICVRGHCFKAELAEDDQARMRGLMYRPRLKDDRAMLFVFPEEAVYGFWMQNMRFALDILWISADGRIVDIKEHFQPCSTSPCESYVPRSAASYVLEINDGLCQRYGVRIGDPVEILRKAHP